MSYDFVYIDKKSSNSLETLAKGKIKFANISLRGFHKFQAGVTHKKHIENIRIWFQNI